MHRLLHMIQEKRVPSFKQRKEKTMMSSVLTKPPPLCWMEFDLQVKKLNIN